MDFRTRKLIKHEEFDSVKSQYKEIYNGQL
jgi:hypothetical protein